MSDQTLEPQDCLNDLDNPKTSAAVERSLNIEAKELMTAKYVLNEELIDTLADEKIHFSLENEIPLKYNMGYYNDTLVYDDPDFDVDAEIQGESGEKRNIKEAISKYTRHDLLEPATKKVIRIDQTVFNSAYFPFNTVNASRVEKLKNIELSRNGGFRDKLWKSAFDVDVEKFAKKEDIKISFDGYIFTFAKFVNKKKEERIELEIEQYNYDKDSKTSTKKCLRKSNVIEGFESNQFEGLKNIANKAIQRTTGNA